MSNDSNFYYVAIYNEIVKSKELLSQLIIEDQSLMNKKSELIYAIDTLMVKLTIALMSVPTDSQNIDSVFVRAIEDINLSCVLTSCELVKKLKIEFLQSLLSSDETRIED